MSQDPALAVHRLASELDQAADAMLLARFGISQSRYRLLHALRHGQTSTQHALAVELGVSDAVVSRMLPALISNDWCQVENDPSHGRRRLVELTPAGAELQNACTHFLVHAFSGASQDAGVDVSRLLADIEALTRQIRRSMQLGRRAAPEMPVRE
ncbi:MarR family winged helix-turn-helix transcriptional regulator [Kineosporia babensis]|uniref:MarR family winged helix-turn-helix transcriptional regulator n=1 Tax=Kineosporia babensis TaxID=499548 RepID=A0A9X1NKD5_9ACTN|nr:MarR family winged helix-turn-helix transcriptional regulator [Kineosporia babensis]